MDTRTTSTLDRPGTDRTSTGVRRARLGDAASMSRTLASAFRDDPVFGWCIPDAGKRHQHLAAWFRVVVDALLDHEETYCTPGAAGAALWVPPGVPPLNEEQGARLGAVMAGIGDAELARSAALSGVMQAHHPHEPHLYLWLLGVHASRQGQGWGGRLLESRLARADEQAVPGYLEATSERNRALYERHGFEVIGELSAEGSPPMWQMWRHPR
jgi:ribosomal protein S18 acetylase RimI-like enzyme